MKKLFLFLTRFYLSKINQSSKIQDFLMWPIATRVLGRKYTELVKLKSGILMRADIQDIVGRFVIFYGPQIEYFWEPQTVKLINLLLLDAKTAINAGSHFGYMALIIRKAMHIKNSRVYAFEPVSYLYKISKENFSLNESLGEIILNNCGLSDRNGAAKISIRGAQSAIVDSDKSDMTTENIEVTKLDDYIQKNKIDTVDFLLLDVEGHEFHVFRGMEKIFSEKPPRDIIFEFSLWIKSEIIEVGQIFDFLSSFGYSLYIINDNFKLKNIVKDWGAPQVCKFWDNLYKFNGKDHFNILVTTRSNDELKKLGVLR